MTASTPPRRRNLSFYEFEVSMVNDVWLMRVEEGLSAHFREEDGSSRPGVQWAIGLTRGEEIYRVLVKALLAFFGRAGARYLHWKSIGIGRLNATDL
jgi:hypothetical protein